MRVKKECSEQSKALEAIEEVKDVPLLALEQETDETRSLCNLSKGSIRARSDDLTIWLNDKQKRKSRKKPQIPKFRIIRWSIWQTCFLHQVFSKCQIWCQILWSLCKGTPFLEYKGSYIFYVQTHTVWGNKNCVSQFPGPPWENPCSNLDGIFFFFLPCLIFLLCSLYSINFTYPLTLINPDIWHQHNDEK